MPKLGVLQCDSLDPPHVDVDGDYDRLFAGLLGRADIEVTFHRADLGDLPGSTAECDAWLVTGSRRSVYEDDDWILALRRLVDRMLSDGTPLVGVCFGHQMIAMEMGAAVAKAECGWNVGAIRYQLHDTPPGDDGPAEFTLIASHQDQVLELPAGATLLASAPSCPIAGYTVAGNVLSVQAHPEFTAALADSLYRSRVERIGAEPIARALDSLDRPLDRRRVSDWITEFVRVSR